MRPSIIHRNRADKNAAMVISISSPPARSEIRFLEYRLGIVSQWPPSPRKTATSEAITRRLTSIARSTLARPEVDDILDNSCRLLDEAFSGAQ